MRQTQLITTKQLSREDIEEVLDRTREVAADPAAVANRLDGTLLGLLFYEPSTRTRMSFETAVKRMGGGTVSLGSVETSSVAKGETLADTVRVVEGYVDALILRHPRHGAAQMREAAGLDGLSIGIMGDLKYGRTVHSLAQALTNFDVHQHFISPESLQLPAGVRYDLHEAGATVQEHTDLAGVLPSLDVLYVTRIQRERFPDENEYRQVAGEYSIDAETLDEAGPDLTVMHPLPRVDEIDSAVDETPHAHYFEQAHNGVPVRMALLDLIL